MIKDIDILLQRNYLTGNLLNYFLQPSIIKLGKVYTKIDIVYSDFTDKDIAGLEEEFIEQMYDMGFNLIVMDSTTSFDNQWNVHLHHNMIFDLPLAKRVTRPSMKILLGVS